eukprot:2777568-Rhodomonas_salina.1
MSESGSTTQVQNLDAFLHPRPNGGQVTSARPLVMHLNSQIASSTHSAMPVLSSGGVAPACGRSITTCASSCTNWGRARTTELTSIITSRTASAAARPMPTTPGTTTPLTTVAPAGIVPTPISCPMLTSHLRPQDDTKQRSEPATRILS